MNKLYSFCPECGPNISCDEDGLCIGCGATAVGSAIDELSAQLERAAKVVKLVREMLRTDGCDGLWDATDYWAARDEVKALLPDLPTFDDILGILKED